MIKSEFNISNFQDNLTASTNITSAKLRAENLYSLGAKEVLELCVGPSFEILKKAYETYGINFFGNDIENRWKKYYPDSSWFIEDCTKLDFSQFQSVVFAPPLSVGCSGKREDSFRINQVNPNYYFFPFSSKLPEISVLVLPARSLSSKLDRGEFFKFYSFLVKKFSNKNIEVFQSGIQKSHRFIRKYLEIYIY